MSCFRTPFGNQRANGFQTLLKSARYHDYPIFPWFQDKLNGSKSSLVLSEIFRLFVNTLTPDDKYSRRNIHICLKQLQTPLSQKEKTFSGFFIAFPKCELNLEHSVRKQEYPSHIITEIIASERDVYLSV